MGKINGENLEFKKQIKHCKGYNSKCLKRPRIT